jgi:titin
LPSTDYYYRAQASNWMGSGDGAIEHFLTVPDTPGKPTATPGDAQATVTVVAGAGGLPDRYTVSVVGDSAMNCTVTPPQTACTIAGLTFNTPYHFQVTATNASGESASSQWSDTVTPAKVPTVTTGAASAIGATIATLAGTVTANAANTSNNAFCYGTSPALVGCVAAGATPSGAGGTSDTAISAHLVGLKPGTAYFYRAQASNSLGSGLGLTESFTTLTAGPLDLRPAASGPATFGTVAVGLTAQLAVDATNTGTAEAIPSQLTAAGAGMALAPGGTCAVGVPIAPGDTCKVILAWTPAVVGPLTGGSLLITYPDGTQQSNMLPVNGNGIDKPGVITDPASGLTTTAATLNGTVNANGSHTVGNAFCFGTDPTLGACASVAAAPASATGLAGTAITAEVSGLAPATVYYFHATATNQAGSSQGRIESLLTAPAIPGKPTAVPGSGLAIVTPVPGPGGTPQRYSVTAIGDASKTCTVTPPATSCTVTGLTNGQPYSFTATATNASGTSSPSAASDPVSPNPAAAVTASLVDLPLQAVPGQRVRFTLRVSGNADGAATITTDGVLACTATIANGSGSCGGTLPGTKRKTGSRAHPRARPVSIVAVFSGTVPGRTGTATATARATLTTATVGISHARLTARRCVTTLVLGGQDAVAGRTVTVSRRAGSRWVTLGRAKVSKQRVWTFIRRVDVSPITVRVGDAVSFAAPVTVRIQRGPGAVTPFGC